MTTSPETSYNTETPKYEKITLGGSEKNHGSLGMDFNGESLRPFVDAETMLEKTGVFADLVGVISVGDGAMRFGILRGPNINDNNLGVIEKIKEDEARMKKRFVLVNLMPDSDIKDPQSIEESIVYGPPTIGKLVNGVGSILGKDVNGRTLMQNITPDGREIKIGRNENNNSTVFTVSDPRISRSQLTLRQLPDGTIKITDMGSTNGTEVYFNSPDERMSRSLGHIAQAAAFGSAAGRPEKNERIKVDIGVAEKPQKGEDRSVHDRLAKIVAVFDGAGGHAGGAKAAEAARLALEADIKSGNYDDDQIKTVEKALEQLERSAYKIQEKVSDTEGITTGVLAKVVDGGDTWDIAYVNVGDSRLYVSREGRADQVTDDEGEGRVLYNAFGHRFQLKQFGIRRIPKGEYLDVVVTSDGIHGDYGNDLLSNDEIAAVLKQGRSAQDAANNLLGIAKKRDDRTAVVMRLQ